MHLVLALRLRAIRQARRLTLVRLGVRSGLTGKFIGEVERGQKSISVDSLYRLAVALDVSLGYLTDMQGPTTQEAERLLALLITLPGSQRRRAYAVLRITLGRASA